MIPMPKDENAGEQVVVVIYAPDAEGSTSGPITATYHASAAQIARLSKPYAPAPGGAFAIDYDVTHEVVDGVAVPKAR